MAENKEKAKAELPQGLKFEPVEPEQLQKLKLQTKKGPQISETAISMSKRMLADLQAGARIPLNSKALVEGKEGIKRLLRRDLEKLARHAGHKNYAVRVIEQPDALVFHYDMKRTQAAAE
jgi:hypothetical protein